MSLQAILEKYAHIPRARETDSQESHEAAARAESFVAGHEAKIFGALHEAGFLGLTAKEIAERTSLDAVQVNRRLGAMGGYRNGVKVGIGTIKLNGARRNGQRVWITS